MKAKNIIFFTAAVFVLVLLYNYAFSRRNAVKTEIREKIQRDTIYIDNTDTAPKVKKEIHIKYVSVPVYRDSIITDSVRLDVVQRIFSDDSTYTAYVSGAVVDSFPRLDSISITQRNIIIDHEIERIIKKKKKAITFGLQVGAGIGVIQKKPDIYIGIGAQWNF
jgi:hypothetical protein